MDYINYIKNPIAVSIIGAIIYYLAERFDCYINARKTSSLNRRTLVVFIILLLSTYFITIEDKPPVQEIFTDIGNF